VGQADNLFNAFRAIVSVTIKVDDAICKALVHRAVDECLSLPGWVGKLLDRQLAAKPAI